MGRRVVGFYKKGGKTRPITARGFRVRGYRKEQFDRKVIDKDVLDVPENRKAYDEAKRALRKAGIRYSVGPQGGVYVLDRKDELRAEKVLAPYYRRFK
jgi:hypothetical protein